MYDKKMFTETFAAIKASEETLTEVLNMTTNKKKSNLKALRVIPIAAAFVLLLSITAFAVVGFTVYENPAAMLRAFFGEKYENHSDGRVEYDEDGNLSVNLPGWERVPVDETLADELIAKYISAETSTISWDGYTLAVEANLYDSQTESGLLYYTIENSDGITGYEVRDKNRILFRQETISFYPGLGDSWTGDAYIDETRSTDTKIYICEYYTGFKGFSKTLDDLAIQVWSYIDGKPIGIAKLNYTNESNIAGLILADGNVLVSPIGIRIYDAALGFESGNDIHRVVLRYNNGTEYILLDDEAFIDNSAYGLIDGVSDPSRTTYLFNRLVDINSLTEVVLDGMVIKVK